MPVSDLKFLLIFALGLLLLIAAAEFFRKKAGIGPEATRKSVHILTGLLVAATPFVLQTLWPMVILGVVFAIVDFFAVRRHLFVGMHNTARETYGTVFYPLSFVLLAFLFWNNNQLIFITAMLIMAISDAVAAMVGAHAAKPIQLHPQLETKSLQGSLAMFLSTLLIVLLSLSWFAELNPFGVLGWGERLWLAGVTAVMATVCEAVSVKGSDNLTVPLGSALVMHYLLTHGPTDQVIFTSGMALAAAIALLSYRARFVDPGGAIGVFVMGTIVFGIGRWAFAAPILVFFVFSSLLSKMGKKRKKRVDGIFEKTGCRDIWQVIANGGLATALLLGWYLLGWNGFYLLFIGSLAAVNADTWATEIGVLSRQTPRSVVTFTPVSVGASGGVTLLGTLGALAGALVLAGTGYLFSPHSSPRILGATEFWLILTAGLLSSFVDSWLGATVQAQYRCAVCSKQTEKMHHCDRTTLFISGRTWINNDVVNGFAALAGILFVLFGIWLL
ncbi:DUF92 domain-containing protein [candidate division KSB1 bacterium]|nr:DUF92 domain-containing protein [candidate division KSB1 bacterium]